MKGFVIEKYISNADSWLPITKTIMQYEVAVKFLNVLYKSEEYDVHYRLVKVCIVM